MKKIGVLVLGILALTATQACRQKQPEPIPGPKAGMSMVPHFHPASIAWFQGSLEEAFAPAPRERGPSTPVLRVDARPGASAIGRGNVAPIDLRQPAGREPAPTPSISQTCPTRREHG
jgi:hypothetical protein